MKKAYISAAILLGLILGQHNGYLALWKSGHPQPEQILPYHISVYPKIDRDALKKGIPIQNAQMLEKLFEDYLS